MDSASVVRSDLANSNLQEKISSIYASFVLSRFSENRELTNEDDLQKLCTVISIFQIVAVRRKANSTFRDQLFIREHK